MDLQCSERIEVGVALIKSCFQSSCPGDGSAVLTASYDSTVKTWNTYSCECTQTLSGHSDAVRSAAMDPLYSRSVHSGSVLSAVFSGDGSSVITACRD